MSADLVIAVLLKVGGRMGETVPWLPRLMPSWVTPESHSMGACTVSGRGQMYPRSTMKLEMVKVET